MSLTTVKVESKENDIFVRIVIFYVKPPICCLKQSFYNEGFSAKILIGSQRFGFEFGLMVSLSQSIKGEDPFPASQVIWVQNRHFSRYRDAIFTTRTFATPSIDP